MIVHKGVRVAGRGASRPAARFALMAALALAGSMALSAASAPVRVLGVSMQGDAVLIEASEPVAYAVSRPDPLTLHLDLRNASAAEAVNRVSPGGPVTGVTVEQATAIDGRAMARVRVALARPAEYSVRAARNVIRVDLAPRSAGTAAAVDEDRSAATVPPATALDRVQATRSGARTLVTLSGNGRLQPASVTELTEGARRLVLDFPDVTARVPARTPVESPLVSGVRVAAHSQAPLVTRVVMELAAGVTYHLERSGTNGRDISVVFEPAGARQAADQLPLPLPLEPFDDDEDAPISLEDAIANAAALAPTAAAVGVDPMAALKSAVPSPLVVAPRAAPPAARPLPQSSAGIPQIPPPAGPADGSPAPRPAVSQGPQLALGVEKKYTGHPISMDFNGMDLRAVLRAFADISGLNMVIDPSVQGTVDIVLNDVPWDQALETILRGNKLGWTVDGTIVRIAPISVLSEEEAERRKLAEAQALAGDLRVQTFALSYARANEMQPLLVRSALSQRGQIQVDQRTNTLIITDLPDRLQTAANLIMTLDRPEPQVEVEARVVQTTRDFARALGIQWGLNGRVSPEIGNTTPLAFPNSGSLGGRLGTQGPGGTDPRAGATQQTGTAVNLPVADANSAIGLALAAVNGAFNIDVALSALERSGKGRVLSTPRLTTQNNIEAEVAQGIQIPIQTVANNTVTVSFKDAVLVLKVTPQITSANTVIMKITIENATPDFSREVNGIPPIDTQRANTQVQVNDGATTVIGGIFVSREDQSNARTPVLHRLPLLGWLFKRERIEDQSRELLIFITPRILKG